MNGGKAFFDTNILLYMYGSADVGKRARAKELFLEYSDSSRIVVSTQVVQEFYVAGSRKLNIPKRELREITVSLLSLPLVITGPAHIESAILTGQQYKISFWDAQILAAAESRGAEVLLTEDLNDGQRYGFQPALLK